jgi:hypothetical protein
MEMAGLDNSRFEVIVRDNSENGEKRAILHKIQSPTVRVINVPNRGSVENFTEIIHAAAGDFVRTWRTMFGYQYAG